MENQLKTFAVRGVQYETGLWTVNKSLDTWTWIVKLVGEPIAALMLGADDEKSLLDQDLEGQVYATAIKALTDKLDSEEIQKRFRAIMHDVRAGGTKIEYDLYFMGKMGLLFQCAFGVLKCQYSDFLEGLPASVTARVGAKMTSTASNAVQ